MATELTLEMVELNEKRIYELVDQQVASGKDPLDIITQCNEGMVEIGRRFEENIYFLSELIMAGEIFKTIMSKLESLLGDGKKAKAAKGTVVIGTVKDDIHDIGKDIVVSMLRGAGFDVVDLGVDVAADKFIKAVRETGAKVVGLSCLLNFTYPQMKKIVDELGAAGLRDQVKVIIGGAPINEDVRIYVGADYYGKDVAAAVSICHDIYQ